MAWSRMYVRSAIQKKNGLFISTVTLSYFGIQHWNEYEIFTTQHDAELWILKQRTGGTLVYDLEEKNEKIEEIKK